MMTIHRLLLVIRSLVARIGTKFVSAPTVQLDPRKLGVNQLAASTVYGGDKEKIQYGQVLALRRG